MTPRAIAIEDPQDLRIAPYTAVRERDLTGRGDRFLVEGKVTLEVLAQRSRFPIESVFVAAHRLAAVAGILAQLPAQVPVYTAPRARFEAIAGFPIHRGVLACARKLPPPKLGALCAAPRLLVAFGLSNHDNVGALFRNAAALGADAVLLDDQSCDPLYRKAIRVSAGTALWLPFHHGARRSACLDALARSGHTVWALTPRASAASIWDVRAPAKLALMVGAEGPGLPPAVLAAATPVRVPLSGGVDSLNVATAAAIAMARAFASPGTASR
ncbi:MAG: RNA methyltransferase [Pseudomonadota bacterium]